MFRILAAQGQDLKILEVLIIIPKMNSIHDKFVTSVQSMESRYKVFNVINEWIDHLKTAPSDLTPTELELPPNVLNEVVYLMSIESIL